MMASLYGAPLTTRGTVGRGRLPTRRCEVARLPGAAARRRHRRPVLRIHFRRPVCDFRRAPVRWVSPVGHHGAFGHARLSVPAPVAFASGRPWSRSLAQPPDAVVRGGWVGGSSPVCREAAWPSVGRTVSPVKARSLPRTTRTHRGRRTWRERQIGGHRRAIAPLWTSRIENGLWPGMYMNPSPGVQSHLDLQQGRPGEGTPAAAEAVGQAVVLPVPSRPFEPAEEVPTRPW